MILAFALPPRNRLSNAFFIYSLTHYAKGTPTFRRKKIDWMLIFCFRFYFTPLSKVLFTFPSRYLFTIGFKSIFRPRRWTSCIQTNIVVLLFWTHLSYNAYRTFTFFGRFFHTFLHSRIKGFGLFHVLSPILTESRLISFPWVTKMFQFTQLNKKWVVVSHGGNLYVADYTLSITFRFAQRPSSFKPKHPQKTDIYIFLCW